MKVLDNIEKTVKGDLKKTIKQDSKISVAAACFSIYAYQELKSELSKVDEVNFIFTSPTFIKENVSKEQKEFYIPRLSREKSLYGTEFEVKLKNELTQKSIAKECVEWIRKKVTFKSNKTNEYMMGFMTVDESTYMPFNGFTTVDLGCERGNNVYYPVQKTESFENSRYYLNLFDTLWKDKNKFTDVTAEVIAGIEEAYKENSPEYLYFFTLYNIFSEFLEDISEDDLPNEATGFKESKVWNTLYNFQQDAALGIINKLEKYNGCILADSVGLGKTFTALAVIKYYENRNKSVLVLCPKKLSENWSTYKGNYINNPIAEDRLRYDILFHTDLSRDKGESNGIDLSRLNWENYDLVVIDESHNFRNGGEISKDGKENRYLKLMNKVLRRGVRTKVLMLSATPVNNKFIDLKNQLALAYEGNTEFINKKLDIDRNIDDIFRQAQRAFNTWSKLPPEERLTDNLLKSLEFDFFEILDSVTIARSRKHIERYYDTNDIGNFPKRLKPISKRPPLTDLESAINYNEIYGQLMSLKLSIYTPSNYIFPSKLSKYEDKSKKKNVGITQKGREEGIRRLMSINLLKRLESSVHSFKLTLNRIEEYIKDTINIIAEYKNGNKELDLVDISNVDFDEDDQNIDLFVVGKKVKIDINDMDYVTWENELKADRDNLELLKLMIADIIPEHDSKLQTLFSLIDNKMRNPINEGNKKIIIFTAFSDTADYLYEHVSEYVKKKYSLDTAEITGSVEGKSTIKGQKMDLNTVLTLFSPISKGKKVLLPGSDKEVDVLIATDCISEGQNLQDCDYLVNYDIHWNPVRIIQRFGRIDRIGSKNSQIQLINFWPDMDLDEYINLKARVETRMKISVLTSTGDDNPISPEEKGDLEYRKLQLKRLQEEVVDLEDMSDGISIMDLGLNEYRMDLLDYIKNGVNFDKVPTGLHTIIKAQEDLPSGVIFVLKNINNRINRDRRNRIHPFYMVYISDDGRVITDYLNPKELLDTLRLLSRGYKEPFFDLCKDFNKETDDGKNMGDISVLLSDAINSVVNVKEESDIDSLFKAGGTSALISTVNGIDDFELISFFVVR
ncbi:TPA: helicase-related protein [Clostridium perfringens]|uniref:helicase-related protein n=1 Tax=Clostridium perfringens TaxID=1502 RepID=UPI001CB3698F|nr:helicase-related protein [Clostridium perfringens]MCX0359007.1 DEAD/DEAH box helicase family protein [Clostridium perfringens]MCX0408045.1 DEAD/DEAH box helicase family protein [Clostridium perfringens]MCX0418088.1 DEAD/DEAH box helicase family protein [Clostridium perfringens]MDU3553309.1 helicase-related protein [Clostridium perfringens]MDU6691642.1 helicase-related protein [Clostridium perfringens]